MHSPTSLAVGAEDLLFLSDIVVLVMVALSLVLAVARKKPPVWAEVGQNLLSAVMNQVVAAVGAAALSLAALHLVFDVVGVGSWGFSGWSWALGFVAVDFTYYWNHRLEHRVSLLWGHHSVHHSSTGFDLTTSLRVAWQDGLTAAFVYGPLAALGMEPTMIVVLVQANLVLQVWIHTQEIRRVPLLEGILNTPAAHRVHHACTPTAIDSNYGGVLMVWDRLFGTYRSEDEVLAADGALRFGLTTGPVGNNPLRVTTAHYAAMAQLWRRCRTLRERVLAVFGPPEWTPEQGFVATPARSGWRSFAPRAKEAG